MPLTSNPALLVFPFQHNTKAIPNNVTLSNSEVAAARGGKAVCGLWVVHPGTWLIWRTLSMLSPKLLLFEAPYRRHFFRPTRKPVTRTCRRAPVSGTPSLSRSTSDTCRPIDESLTGDSRGAPVPAVRVARNPQNKRVDDAIDIFSRNPRLWWKKWSVIVECFRDEWDKRHSLLYFWRRRFRTPYTRSNCSEQYTTVVFYSVGAKSKRFPIICFLDRICSE